MTDPETTPDAEPRDGAPVADRSESPASETTAATEPMPETTPDADERDRSPNDADPDALFEDERDPGARPEAGEDASDGPVALDDGPITKLYWAGLAAAAAFGAFALYRFYASVTTAIDVWVAADYQPLLQAAFNFAVLLGAALAASLLLRRLSVRRA